MTTPLTPSEYDGSRYELRPKIKKLLIVCLVVVIFVISITGYVYSKYIKLEIQTITGKTVNYIPVNINATETINIGFNVINHSPFDVELIISSTDYDVELNYSSIILYREIKTYVVVGVYNPTIDNKNLKLLIDGDKK